MRPQAVIQEPLVHPKLRKVGGAGLCARRGHKLMVRKKHPEKLFGTIIHGPLAHP
jgi:hypothetical protein